MTEPLDPDRPHVFTDDGLGTLARAPGTGTCMHCSRRQRDPIHDVIVTRFDASGPHVADESTLDPGFCRCGLALDAWVHAPNARYVSRPLTEQVWRELRGGDEGDGA